MDCGKPLLLNAHQLSRNQVEIHVDLTRSSYRNCRFSYVWGWPSFVEKAPVLPTDC